MSNNNNNTIFPPKIKITDDDKLWCEVLPILKGQLPTSTYNLHFKNTKCELQTDGTLIIFLKNHNSIEWIENRMYEVVKRAVKVASGKDMPLAFQLPLPVPEENNQPEAIENTNSVFNGGYYGEVYNEIVQPDRILKCTHYFRENWVPLLGEKLAWFVMDLRQECYWNKETDEKRNQFTSTDEAIYKKLGLSRTTFYRYINPKNNKYISLFIQRVTLTKFSEAKGCMVNTGTRWKIRLDDPLTPKDELIYIERVNNPSTTFGT